MRGTRMRSVAAAAAGALALATLTACAAGPNPEAVAAAEEYSEQLSGWADGLEEGAAAEPAPELAKVEGAENTPIYGDARSVAAAVSVVHEELAALTDERLDELGTAADEAFWVVADLYYDTLSADSDRIAAFTAAIDLRGDDPAYEAALIEANHAFWIARGPLLERAIEEFPATAPDGALGASVAAFAVDWFEEELGFQQRAVEHIESTTAFGNVFKGFWNLGNLNEVFRAPVAHADELRAGYVEQAQELAVLLAAEVDEPREEGEPLELPAAGEPYRQVLIDGYRPWDDPEADQDFSTGRLWMLWRIRELEKTPDDAYSLARATLLEELNRSLEEDAAADFRPGATRLLNLVARYSEEYDQLRDLDRYWLDGLAEVVAYGEMLREGPMTPEVAEAFDEILALYEELGGLLEQAADKDPDDAYLTALELGDEYQDKIVEAATPALEQLDDDARYEELLAERLTATRP